MPRRLSASVQPAMLADDDVRQLMRHDIRTAVGRPAQLKPAIVTAYRQASPEGQRAIEAAVSDVDAGLAATLRAGAT